MNTEKKHAEFSPSGFARRFHCPASYLLEQGQPDVASAIADEGTEIHAQVADIIVGNSYADETSPLAQRCYDRFETVVQAFDNPSVYVEKTLSATVGDTDNFGTIDALVVGNGDAVIIDWKTGYGKVDHPSRNWQIKWYAVFVFDNFPAVQGVKAIVYNPRIWQDDSHYFRREELGEIKSSLAEVIALCKAGSPAPKVGEWCDYCRAKGICPAVKNALQAYQSATPICRMGDEQLTALYAKIDAVKGICDEITIEMKRRLRESGNIGGYSVKTVSGAYDVVDNGAMLDALAGELTTAEIASTAKYSVNAIADALYAKRKQAGEKATKAGVKADLIDTLADCIKRRPDQERIVKE